MENYLEELDQGAYELGHNLDEATRNDLEEKIAEVQSKLEESPLSPTSFKKIKWNGSVKELVGIFAELKNRQTGKKDLKGNFQTYIQATNEEIETMILSSFNCMKMKSGTIQKGLRNVNERKKTRIDFE